MLYVDFGEEKMFEKDNKNILDFKDEIMEKLPNGWTAKALDKNSLEIYNEIKVGVYKETLKFFIEYVYEEFRLKFPGDFDSSEDFITLNSLFGYIDSERNLTVWHSERVTVYHEAMRELECFKQLLHNKMFMIRKDDFNLNELEYLLNKK